MFSLVSKAIAKNRPTQGIKLTTPKRFLNIHEYQGINLLKKHGVHVMEGSVASTPEEAESIARTLDTPDLIIKAQVHCGGRGKGHFDNGFKGGVHFASTPEDIKHYSLKMLTHRLYTAQTGHEGKLCNQVFVGKRSYVRREAYFAVVLDRSHNGPVLVGSPKGGVNIEQVAHDSPEAIFKVPVNIFKGFNREDAKTLASNIGFRTPQLNEDAVNQMERIYKMFVELDCTQIEINPFCETVEGKVLSLDSKINFDSNAEFRHPHLKELRDPSQEDRRELEASKFDLNFIGLEGDIGCLVNGAGLAMATMDMIQLHGGAPANFLDIGGGANDIQVTEALRIISSDINVNAILINIFGGIMKCDIIALGLLNAVKNLNLHLPLVVRLQGTNVKEAKEILDSSGLRIIAADDLDEAAIKAVKISKIINMAKEAELNVHFELPI